ncbi:hypothetical protein ACT8ZV_13270 [Nocardioides sp. MAHUQ-72]|uniref:hypothetical protein n=1 Tax=unclassified Nocardioides TaxID=2615069 RepID=UPI003608ED65
MRPAPDSLPRVLFDLDGTLLGDVRELDDRQADEAFLAYLSAYEASWRPFDDVRPTFDWLCEAGVEHAILSNGDRDQQLAKVAALGLACWLNRGGAPSPFDSREPVVEIGGLRELQHLLTGGRAV